jgi:hypothetical protein
MYNCMPQPIGRAYVAHDATKSDVAESMEAQSVKARLAEEHGGRCSF